MGKNSAYAKIWTTQHFQKMMCPCKNEKCVIKNKKLFFLKKKICMDDIFFVFEKIKKHDEFEKLW